MTDPTPTNTANAPAEAGPAPGANPAARGRSRLVLLAAGAVAVLLAVTGVAYVLTRPAEPGFDTPEGIASLLADRGAPCDDFEAGGQGHADERGTCYADGKKMIIATFGSRAEVESHWQRQLGAAVDGEAVGMVIGDNWSISGGSRAYLRHAAEVLGAEFRSN